MKKKWNFAAMLFLGAALAVSLISPAYATFRDVPESHWAAADIRYVAERGLFQGTGDTGSMENHPFTDMAFDTFSFSGYGPIYNEAKEAMLGWAWPNGIITGSSATKINPTGRITRAEVAAMLSRFDRNVLGGTEATVTIQPDPEPEPSTDSENRYEGYTLANGKPLSEENVTELLWGLMESYPAGTLYGAPYCSTSAARGPYGSSGSNCAGWAMLCSDAAFGDLTWRRITNPSWDEIRAGDLVRYDTESSGHVVVVLEKADDYILVTESGLNNKARWGGQYFSWWLEAQSGYTLYTRYPQ